MPELHDGGTRGAKENTVSLHERRREEDREGERAREEEGEEPRAAAVTLCFCVSSFQRQSLCVAFKIRLLN